jgi:Leucine-rich repeat (LRR) protein
MAGLEPKAPVLLLSSFITPAMVKEAKASNSQKPYELDLEDKKITDLKGVEKLEGLYDLEVSRNLITSLANVKFPDSLISLNCSANHIASLARVQFPRRLRLLNLSFNQIESIAGVEFPPNLESLMLPYNQITSLAGVVFPPHLKVLLLDANPITSLDGVTLPHSLQDFKLDTSNITSLTNFQCPSSLQVESFNILRSKVDPALQFNPDVLLKYKTRDKGVSYRDIGGRAVNIPTTKFVLKKQAVAAAAAGPADAEWSMFVPDQAMTTFDAGLHMPDQKSPNVVNVLDEEPDYQGGSKSKTRRRQRQRQNKRNRKNKYSRRRRNAKSSKSV